MVYVALGILAISVTVYVYTYSRPRRPRGLLQQSSQETLKKQAHEDVGGNRQPDESAHPKNKQRLERSPKRAETTPSSFPSEDLESPSSSPETTPRASPSNSQNDALPSFTLDGIMEDRVLDEPSPPEDDGSHDPTSPRKPSKTESQGQPLSVSQASMLPPPRPNRHTAQRSSRPTPSLMPPPSRPPPTANRAPPKPSSTLAPPPSAASTLRAPPSRSLAPTASSLPPSSRPSKKVLLAPGHSPLDWAHLVNNPPSTTFLRGASVPSQLIRVPPSLLKYHNGRKGRDAWGVWQGKVYNMTPYKDFHPGGVDQLMRGAGKEGAEKLFMEIHPWVSWDAMLGECLVGILVSEEEAKGDGRMEEMD